MADPRRRLESERSDTEQRIATMAAELDQLAAASAGSNADDEHDPEGATLAFERAQLAAARAGAQRHLADIATALDRVAAGTYDICDRCGGAIGAERLDALPVTRVCTDCARRRD